MITIKKSSLKQKKKLHTDYIFKSVNKNHANLLGKNEAFV